MVTCAILAVTRWPVKLLQLPPPHGSACYAVRISRCVSATDNPFRGFFSLGGCSAAGRGGGIRIRARFGGHEPIMVVWVIISGATLRADRLRAPGGRFLAWNSKPPVRYSLACTAVPDRQDTGQSVRRPTSRSIEGLMQHPTFGRCTIYDAAPGRNPRAGNELKRGGGTQTLCNAKACLGVACCTNKEIGPRGLHVSSSRRISSRAAGSARPAAAASSAATRPRAS